MKSDNNRHVYELTKQTIFKLTVTDNMYIYPYLNAPLIIEIHLARLTITFCFHLLPNNVAMFRTFELSLKYGYMYIYLALLNSRHLQYMMRFIF